MIGNGPRRSESNVGVVDVVTKITRREDSESLRLEPTSEVHTYVDVGCLFVSCEQGWSQLC